MQHEMPQSLLVFAVSLTPETPNFETFGGVAHPPPPLRNFSFFSIYVFQVCICTYLKFKLRTTIDIKKKKISECP